MDKTDILLFRELAQGNFMDYFRSDARLPLNNLAKDLKVNVSTVKRRFRQWQDSGFLEHIRIEPNMNLFGLCKAMCDFKLLTSSKERLVSALKLIDGILFIMDMFGHWIRVEFVFDDKDDFEKKVGLIRAVTGATKCLELQHALSPPINVNLTKTDWRVIKSLRYDARKSYSQIAQEMGLSTKTVKRRYKRLIENKAIIARFYPNFKSYPKTVFASLLAFYSENAPRQEVSSDLRKKFDNNYFLCLLGSPQFAAFLLSFNSLYESENVLHEAESAPGVKNVKLDLINDIIVVDEWLDKKIAGMID